MWVWNNSNQVNNILNDYWSARSNLLQFCKSPHGNSDHKISVLFFSCRQAVYDNSDALRDFISELNDSSMILEFLDGDPTWATYNQETGYERIRKVIEFNDSSNSIDEKIKGIQFDVEPYLLKEDRGYQPPYWDTNRTEVWESFVSFVDSCQAIVDSSDTDLYFGVAIPRWYENHVGIDELKRFQSIVDYVAIMDYNERSSVIINDAANEVMHAEELSKKLWIGVETKEVSPETVSFAEEGVAYMEGQLDTVYAVYGENEVFNGFAIHSYAYYRELFFEPVSVKKNDELENRFILKQNYPNPFNPSTNIEFYIPESQIVKIFINNSLGEIVDVIEEEKYSEGWHKIEFLNKKLSTGIYFYTLLGDQIKISRKMILLK